MKLSLTNIGKIKNAVVEINGITIIAGENNTGKSTVGKALFSVFNGFHNTHAQIREAKTEGIVKLLDNFLIDTGLFFSSIDSYSLSEDIVGEIEKRKNIEVETVSFIVEEKIKGHCALHGLDPNFKKISSDVLFSILDVFKISEESILEKIIGNRVYEEFNGQITDINQISHLAGCIKLTVDTNNAEVILVDNSVEKIIDPLNLRTEAVYIDNPFIVDSLPGIIHGNRRSKFRDKYQHDWHLSSKITTQFSPNIVSQIILDKRFVSMFKKIGLASGVDWRGAKTAYIKINSYGNEQRLNIKNLSTGMKTFFIIKVLLTNGTLKENGTLILDEPEIHLHPEWQILFAELIVLLQKEFNMHILLNTHSPYFLRAIEVYAGKHEIADKCKYYLSGLGEDGYAKIDDVSDNVEAIYAKLAEPFQILENESIAND